MSKNQSCAALILACQEAALTGYFAAAAGGTNRRRLLPPAHYRLCFRVRGPWSQRFAAASAAPGEPAAGEPREDVASHAFPT
jgi:hypothetical protein